MQFLLFKLVLAQLVYLGACSATRFTSKIAPPRAYLIYAVDATFHAEFSNDHQAVSIFAQMGSRKWVAPTSPGMFL